MNSDFVLCSKHNYILSVGSKYQLWNMKFRIQLHLTLINKFKNIVTLEWFCIV